MKSPSLNAFYFLHTISMGTAPVGVDRKNTRNGLFRQKRVIALKKVQ